MAHDAGEALEAELKRHSAIEADIAEARRRIAVYEPDVAAKTAQVWA